MATVAAVSIRNSLPQPLPVYAYAGAAHVPGASGATTQATVPPRFAVPRPAADRWVNVGRGFLAPVVTNYQVGICDGIVRARDDLVTMLQPGFQPAPTTAQRNAWQASVNRANVFLGDVQKIPETEKNIQHGNEADIVRTATLYLVHPVIQALCAHPSYQDCLISKSEDTQGGTRTDVTFKKVYFNQAGQQKTRSFAILEFKRRGAIQGDDFRHQALGPPGSVLPASNTLYVAIGQVPSPQQLAAVTAIVPPAPPNPNIPRTMFTGGPLALIKQATAYSIEHRTQYVVLFNYDWMICCYFPWLDPTKSKVTLSANNRASQGEFPVEVDIYRYSPANVAEMRLALLGFMWTAIENTPI